MLATTFLAVGAHALASAGAAQDDRSFSAPGPPGPAPAPVGTLWTRGRGVSVSVDPSTFLYSAALNGSDACTLSKGGIALRCEGVSYSSFGGDDNSTVLRLLGPASTHEGTDSRLGAFDAITAKWQGGASAACAVSAEVRYFAAVDAFVFTANFSAAGVPGTNTSFAGGPGGTFNRDVSGNVLRAALSTAFPTWPAAERANSCSYLSYYGNSLRNNFRGGALQAWAGGLEGGPLLLYPTASVLDHPPALLLSPLTHAKAMVGNPSASTDRHVSQSDLRVAFGVQGLVEELPPAFASSVILVGRSGIAATQMAWGATLTQHAGTSRLTLDADILNSKITYWTDNGAYYCYCNVPGDRRVPMHIIIKNLTDYHRSLGLHIDMYHIDSGFWHSAHADGHCDWVYASNWSASEFHWPHVDQIGDGLGEKVWGKPFDPSQPASFPPKPTEEGSVSWQMLYMLLAGSNTAAARPGNESAHGNVYGDPAAAVRPQGGPWAMQDDDYAGQKNAQVRHDQAHGFWDAVIGYGFRENNLRAMVIDTLQVWFEEFHDRTNNTWRHEQWMDGYLGPSGGVGPGGASKYGLPVRVDQALPSDHLASAVLNWPAVVSARIGGDMDDQTGHRAANTWSQMASTGAFLSALQIRPVMDVLWTEPVQPDNTEHLAFRAYIDHELVIAVLTCGPVGFGDSLPGPGFKGTNVTKLLLASRADGVILKPAHTALPLDISVDRTGRFGSRIWAAPSVPAHPAADPSSDRRANSFVRLAATDGRAESAEGRWWYTLLATDVLADKLLSPSTLFPVPPAGLAFVARTFGENCANGALASSCLAPFSDAQPLHVYTPGQGSRLWRVYGAAPVMAGGWVLVGEEAKYVAMSPQRILSSTTAVAPAPGTTESDALRESELQADGKGLRFTIAGAVGEVVSITIVAPMAATAAAPAAATVSGEQLLARALASKIVVVTTTLGASGRASVQCTDGACAVSTMA